MTEPTTEPAGDPYAIAIPTLKAKAKPATRDTIERIDTAGDSAGFGSREAKARGGRQPSPRTGQIHAKVLPHVSEEIASEAARRGVTQGVLIEEAWALYRIRV